MCGVRVLYLGICSQPNTLSPSSLSDSGTAQIGPLNLMSKITVLLADDHPMVRRGIAAILAAESDVELVGEAENGAQAVALAEQIHPRVVIMDIAMPVMNGIEATRQIVSRFPETKVLVLSSYNDTDSVSQVAAAGASGFIPKLNASSELVDSIRHAAR